MSLPKANASAGASSTESDLTFQRKTDELVQSIKAAVTEFHPKLALASSFGSEDMVLVDTLARVRPGALVFYLDTDLLFEETYRLIEVARKKYPLNFERVATEVSVEEQERLYGPALWSRIPSQCCEIRKVEPLKKMLSKLDAWITGIRREQSPTRANSEVREWDSRFGLAKINPLAYWSNEDVWKYIMKHNVPYNPMHDRNYPSIGCIHCTAPVLPGQDPRSGRWPGFAKTECGLHIQES